MAEKLLEQPKQEWVENHLEKWGAWVFSGLDFESRMNMIAKLMLSADPDRIAVPEREMCGDELGLAQTECRYIVARSINADTVKL